MINERLSKIVYWYLQNFVNVSLTVNFKVVTLYNMEMNQSIALMYDEDTERFWAQRSNDHDILEAKSFEDSFELMKYIKTL